MTVFSSRKALILECYNYTVTRTITAIALNFNQDTISFVIFLKGYCRPFPESLYVRAELLYSQIHLVSSVS